MDIKRIRYFSLIFKNVNIKWQNARQTLWTKKNSILETLLSEQLLVHSFL
jgi:hypothetical protein